MERHKILTPVKERRKLLSAVALACVLLFIVSCAGPHSSLKDERAPRLSDIKNLLRLPLIPQSKDYTCGAAALQSVLLYYGEEFREDQLLEVLQSTVEEGTDYRRMVQFVMERGYRVAVLSEMSVQGLQEMIDRRIPVIVGLQAWPEQPVNWETSFDEGHYAVVVGYDKGNIYFMDPSTPGHYTFISTDEFLRRWHDKHRDGTILNRFGIMISKDRPYYDPEDILYMK